MAEAKKKQKTEPKKADQKLDHSQDYKCVELVKVLILKKVRNYRSKVILQKY